MIRIKDGTLSVIGSRYEETLHVRIVKTTGQIEVEVEPADATDHSDDYYPTALSVYLDPDIAEKVGLFLIDLAKKMRG